LACRCEALAARRFALSGAEARCVAGADGTSTARNASAAEISRARVRVPLMNPSPRLEPHRGPKREPSLVAPAPHGDCGSAIYYS
jgi:hypothetical protein